MTHRFEFNRRPGVTPMDVELMLRRYGLPITGRDLGEYHETGDGGNGDKVNRNDYGWYALSVPQARAAWAEYLLCRWGNPARTEWVNPANANVPPDPAHMPPEWGAPAEAKTPMDWILKIMCLVTGGAKWDLRPQAKRQAQPTKRKAARLGRTFN